MTSVIKIQLTNGREAIIDSEDADKVAGKSWYAVEYMKSLYARTGRGLGMHRVILGINDPSVVVDHVNGNGLDNRKENLRTISSSENVKNRQRSRIGNRCPGVYREGGKWRAKVTVDYKTTHIGTFEDEDDAILAVNEYRIKIGRPPVCLAM